MRIAAAICASWWLLACSPGPQPPRSTCLPYGPRAVTLSGQAVTQMLPDESGATRNLLLLQLDAPICVGDARQPRIRKIRLVPQSSFEAAYSLAGAHVTATGPLSPADTARHQPLVIMTLQSIGPR